MPLPRFGLQSRAKRGRSAGTGVNTPGADKNCRQLERNDHNGITLHVLTPSLAYAGGTRRICVTGYGGGVSHTPSIPHTISCAPGPRERGVPAITAGGADDAW